MDHTNRLTWGTLRIGLLAVVALFLIPALTYALSIHIFETWDQRFASAVFQKVAQDKRGDAELYVALSKPSVVCRSTDPLLAESRAQACRPFSNIWQVSAAQTLAVAAMIGGALLIALVFILSLAAFGNRSIQYLSFVTGKQVMIWGSAAEVLVQGTMLVWLSYWVSAFFFKVFIAKLIVLVAIVVGIAVLAAVFGIFRRDQSVNTQTGVLIGEADAPRLWERIRQMAARLKTAPPKQIVAGIDANFFVTEAPLKVGADVHTGRTLYVSLPLLRTLDVSEADSVLAHELAHLSGGDTANSAKLGPALLHYDQYCANMRGGGATIVVWPILALYRILFELALARSRREREFRADRVAAKLVSPHAIAQSLVKVAAYSIYRSKIENELFEHQTQHSGALGIAAAIDRGLVAYVQSPAFMEKISTAHIPHPFDSHPPLSERIQAVGLTIGPQDYSAIAAQAPQWTWAGEIVTADVIEGRLWSAFDQEFAAFHERILAYRYEPATDAERALVLTYFPTRAFPLKNNAQVEISYAGMHSSITGELVPWGAVTGIKYKESTFFADALAVSLQDGGRKQTKTVKLPGLGKSKAELQAVIGAYWQRDKIMRQHLAKESL